MQAMTAAILKAWSVLAGKGTMLYPRVMRSACLCLLTFMPPLPSH